VVIENCRLTGTENNCVLKLKLRPDTEQHYENITARNITVDNPAAKLVSIEPWTQFFDLQGKPAPGQIATNITLENITGTLRDFGTVNGPEKSTVANLVFRNINVKLNNPAVTVRNAKGVTYDGVMINGAAYTGVPAAGK
jgi:alpha-L-rhamnosidase